MLRAFARVVDGAVQRIASDLGPLGVAPVARAGAANLNELVMRASIVGGLFICDHRGSLRVRFAVGTKS